MFFEDMEMNQKIRTENGALGYATTGRKLLDLNFSAPKYRKESIWVDYLEAWNENPMLALRWAFFARDIKGGLGERRLFREILENLVTDKKINNYTLLFSLVEKYGRYDDYINLIDVVEKENLEGFVAPVAEQIAKDILRTKTGKPITLLGKWMPSINASSKVTKVRARKYMHAFGLSEREYRQMLSDLRKYTNVVEAIVSRGDWGSVNYEAVPSLANLKYKDAFLKHDNERRRDFLASLEKGEAKINASTTYPCDIVAKYNGGYWDIKPYDATLEGMWKNLPDHEISNTLVVADGSGSMYSSAFSSVSPLNVANSLAIYFSERNHGEFANKYITFSEHPQFVKFGENMSLHDKIKIALKYDECANTDIVAVFRLILDTAIKKKVPQNDMPQRILIISDMEFDSGAEFDEVLFETIARSYAAFGYKLPKLIFWNVASRTGTIPVRENDNGVALISGYSPAIADMVMSEEIDPYKILVEKLESYEDVDGLIKSF